MSLAEYGVAHGLTLNFLEVMGCLFIGVLISMLILGVVYVMCAAEKAHDKHLTNKNEGGNDTEGE